MTLASAPDRKRRRAARTSRRLTEEDAVDVHRLYAKGIPQHDIAAAFGVNQGRISEIITGKRFPRARLIAERST